STGQVRSRFLREGTAPGQLLLPAASQTVRQLFPEPAGPEGRQDQYSRAILRFRCFPIGIDFHGPRGEDLIEQDLVVPFWEGHQVRGGPHGRDRGGRGEGLVGLWSARLRRTDGQSG